VTPAKRARLPSESSRLLIGYETGTTWLAERRGASP